MGTIATVAEPSFQDQMRGNHCWGCGPHNQHGLNLKSFWEGDDHKVAVAAFQPQPFHTAGPDHVLNGGIIATVLDCHSVCTAMATAYAEEGRPITSDPEIWFATGALDVTYLRPAPIDRALDLRATVEEIGERKIKLSCTLSVDGLECARADVVAVRVPDEWRSP